MGLPTVTQTWTWSINNRYTFLTASTLQNVTSNFMFSLIGVGGFLTTTMGYTCKGSCDGTTGAMDGVNRITAASKWTTRVNGSTSPISWIVLTDGAGIDWCFAYNSASDDIVRCSHSQGGVYVAAATPSNQPTATDECFDTTSGTWVGSTASLDRVWTMMASSDKKMWRFVIYRSGVMQSLLQGERFTNALVSPATFTEANGGGTVGAIKCYSVSTQLNQYFGSYTASSEGTISRAHCGGQDINIKPFLAGEAASVGASTTWNAEKPALQGGTGELLFPVQMYATVASSDGKLGSMIDSWYALSNSNTTPSPGDTFGNLQFLCLSGGGPIWPLDGLTTPVTS